jgi:cytochrome b6-f complex iron-sulfur subunit
MQADQIEAIQKNESINRESVLSRRNFLALGVTALGAVAAFELGSAAILYVRSRSLEGSFGGVVVAGEISKFVPNSVTEYPESYFYLVRAADGGFLALYRRCPHLGCSVEWEGSQEVFNCPCHGSSFDKLGNLEDRPVPSALDLFEIEIKDDRVLVDTSRIIRRDQFNISQLTYADSGEF